MTQRDSTVKIVPVVELMAGYYVLTLSSGATLEIEIPKGEKAFISEKS